MADNTTISIPDAVLKAYSRKLLHDALPSFRWMEFAAMQEDLLARPSDTLVFTKYDDFNGPTALTENVHMAGKSMASSRIELTVTEYGTATTITEKLVVLSWDDMLGEAALLLGRNYSKWGPDYLMKSVAQIGAGTTIYPNAATSRVTVGATDFFDADVVREANERLQTANVPKFRMEDGEEFYVCIAHPRQLRYLRQDPAWVDANNYHRTRRLFNGETGSFDGVIFVSDSSVYNGVPVNGTGSDGTAFLDNGGGDNALKVGIDGNLTDIYMASIFGDGAFAFASALPVELRQEGVVDFGREHGLAWYAIYGAGMLHSDFMINIESA